jgi:ubiquinone biosynthesis protein COQ9
MTGTGGEALFETKRAILREALRAAPFDGWSSTTLRQAAAAAGIDEALAGKAFPQGAKQLLAFFMAEADRDMVAGAARRGLGQGPVRTRIGAIIRLRLENLAPHREAIRRALALQLLPGRGPAAIAGLYRTVDAIWRAAGDDSTDFNFYTKRAILAVVYGATLLRWLDDSSEGNRETWAFMERRLAGVPRLGKARRRAEKLLRRLPSPLSPLARLRHGRSG